MRALLCSGQGQIERGMFDRLSGDQGAEAVLQAAAQALGQDPRGLLANGSAEQITVNRTGQLLCVARSLAASAALRVAAPTMVAGYSVGEMSAWAVAGVWSPEQTLRLTARRAELMDVADGGEGGLGFVRGLDPSQLHPLLASHGCAVAIRNPGGLYIVGGGRADVAACCADALRMGAAAAHHIAVKVASHTPRLATAVAPFRDLLTHTTSEPPRAEVTLIGAADAAVIRRADAASVAGLAGQIASMVDWEAVLIAMVERGVRRVLELGPGNALARMVRGAWPEVEARGLDDFSTIEGARRWFAAG